MVADLRWKADSGMGIVVPFLEKEAALALLLLFDMRGGFVSSL